MSLSTNAQRLDRPPLDACETGAETNTDLSRDDAAIATRQKAMVKAGITIGSAAVAAALLFTGYRSRH